MADRGRADRGLITSSVVAERRREMARQLLLQADALHLEVQRAQSVAQAEEDVIDNIVEERQKRASSERRSEKVTLAEMDVRRLKQRALAAKNALHSAQRPRPVRLKQQPLAGTRSNARGAAVEQPAAATSEDETTRQERLELHRLKQEIATQERENAVLRAREVALSGVLCSLTQGAPSSRSPRSPRASNGKRGGAASGAAEEGGSTARARARSGK